MIRKILLFITVILLAGSAGYFGRQYYEQYQNIEHEKLSKKQERLRGMSYSGALMMK